VSARPQPGRAPATPLAGRAPVGWRRAGQGELWALGAYFIALVAVTDYFNVRLGVELLSLSVFVAALVITRAPVLFLRDWWFVVAGMVMWNLSGAIAAQSPFPWHLDFMLNLDRLIGLGHEPVQVVQQHLSTPGTLTVLDWLTAGAYNMHLAEPFIAGYFLWRLDRAVYCQFVAAALALLVLGLITFIVFPAVPPWLAAYDLVHMHGRYFSTRDWTLLHDLGIAHPVQYIQAHGHVYLPGVVNLFGPVLAAHPRPFHGTPIFYLFKLQGDPVAAFPSEHAAFPLLELLAFRLVSRRVAVVLLLWVLAVVFTVLYLGEHWVTDVLAGWIYSLVIFGFVRWYTTRRTHPPAAG
jgi:membrane-associated phospholipid phosphatase